jgi:predicted DNA-binding protein
MIKSDKKLKELTQLLNKDNNLLITEAIGFLREELPFEGAIGLLTSYYDKSDNLRVRESIEEFMNDLKDQSATKEIINEIRKQWKANTISMLVSSCWQSGLNYSDYSADLVEVFLYGDYVTAIECLTVIEETVSELTRQKKDEIIRIIENRPLPPDNEKTVLFLELIAILGK